MKRYIAFFVLVLGTLSCSKPKPAVPLPPAEASLIRNLVFTNQTNVEKNKSYPVATVVASAGINEGQLYITFEAGSTQPGSVSESVTLYINAAHLQNNLAKGYTFGLTEPALTRVFYVYSFHENAGSTWGSLIDSKTGVQFQGLLNITSYDARNKAISGSYVVKAPNMIHDPTTVSIGLPVDPLNQCDLTLTGTFSNVLIAQ